MPSRFKKKEKKKTFQRQSEPRIAKEKFHQNWESCSGHGGEWGSNRSYGNHPQHDAIGEYKTGRKKKPGLIVSIVIVVAVLWECQL
jgi:hypothetical protein